MKAIVASSYGTPEVLQLKEMATPSPKPNEILVKIYATTANVGDCRMRSFTVPPIFWLPARLTLGLTKPKQPIFGMELAGKVEAVGKDVTRFKVGDAVFASTFAANFGAYAEYKCLSENGVVALKPINLTYEEAAAVPLSGLTALSFLRKAQLKQGQKVLINGASGAVGTYAVQIAKHFGAVVTGVCSTSNVELVRSLGADHIIDYRQADFTKNQQDYDIIFDSVAKTTFQQCRASLKEGGHYINTVMPTAALVGGWYPLTTGKRVIGGNLVESSEDLEFLKSLIEANVLRPIIDRCYPLIEIAEAHRYVETGHKKGNVVITVQTDEH